MRAGWCRTAGVAVLLGLAALQAQAEEPKADPKRQVVRFDDDTISGDLLRPDGDLVSARPELELPSLVEPPRSFARASQRIRLAAAAAARDPIASEKTKLRRTGEGGDGGRRADPPGGVR